MVIDARHSNKFTIPDLYLIPRLDDINCHLALSTCYAAFDASSGYWQCSLHPDSSQYFAFITMFGNWEYLVLPMGGVNSAPYFQKCLETVIGEDLMYNGVLQYVDDTLVYAKNPEQLLKRLRTFFTRLDMFNVKLHPKKADLFSTQLVWGGRLLSEHGQTVAPNRVETIKNMRIPTMLDELMQFVHSANWHRKHIPMFSKIAAPCYDLIQKALAHKKYPTKRAAKNIKLSNLPDWDNNAKESFNKIRKAMIHTVTTSFYDNERVTCVFGDASDKYWGMVITQIPAEDLPKPVQEQDHKPLAFVSGKFRGSQLRWAIIDKEAYFIGEQLPKYQHWVNGGKHTTLVYTDHRNLVSLFSSTKPSATTTKAGRARRIRWTLNIQPLTFKIVHIPGEDNTWADLLSRWGLLVTHPKCAY